LGAQPEKIDIGAPVRRPITSMALGVVLLSLHGCKSSKIQADSIGNCTDEKQCRDMDAIHDLDKLEENAGTNGDGDGQFSAISGRWLSMDGSTEIVIRNRVANFQTKKDGSLFKELDGESKVLDNTLGFDHDPDNYFYDIYWVWSNPDELTLLKKPWKTEVYVSMKFVRMRQ
jgi:hypothetical protein